MLMILQLPKTPVWDVSKMLATFDVEEIARQMCLYSERLFGQIEVVFRVLWETLSCSFHLICRFFSPPSFLISDLKVTN